MKTVMAVVMGAAGTLFGQSAGAPLQGALSAPVADLQQVSGQINQAMDVAHPQRWKIKGEDRDAALRNIDSVRRDVNSVLPAMLGSAAAAPDSVTAGLAVYRNINALYDVMVRLQQTASISGKDEAASLQDALLRLEAARAALADKIAALADVQEKALAQARQAVAAQQAATMAPKHIVADDAAPVKKKASSRSSQGRTKPSAAKQATGSTKTASSKPSAASPAQ